MPTNPLTRKFINDLRLRVPDRVESYTDDELAKLLRGSHVRIAREAGFPAWLIQANLGHSTPLLTENTYGRISIDALRTAARGTVASRPSAQT